MKGGKDVRRLFCLCLTCLLLTAFVGCGGGPATSEPMLSDALPGGQSSGGPQNFAVAYSEEDTLNPFEATTEVNLSLAGALYDGLVVIKEDFSSELSLAQSIDAQDESHFSAILREDVRFSDGSRVQPSDVVFSFQKAKASPNYRELLSSVTAASVNKKTSEVVFTVTCTEPNAYACFSFPVVKASSWTTAVGEAPIGGGTYMLKKTDSGPVLHANPFSNPRRNEQPFYTTVSLRHLPNTEAMYYGFASGNITYYYNDLSQGDPQRVSGASAAVNMNALFYLGCNSARYPLNEASVRRALSKLVDRQSLASAAFSGWAEPSASPYHPVWSGTPSQETRDLPGALTLLEGFGYGTAAGQIPLTLELIYSNEGGFRSAAAEAIRSQLESAGLLVMLTPLAYSDYMARLQAGQFDLYLGEVRLPATMSLAALMPGGSCGFGVSPDNAAVTLYKQCLTTASAEVQKQFSQVFNEELPFIPLCFRKGFAAYDRRLTTVTPHGYNPFYGIASWS